jgi:hypothetical protein
MSDPNDSTSTGHGLPFSSAFLEFCAKVRNNDLSILPEPGEPLQIRQLSEKEGLELADALLENNIVTYIELNTGEYTKSSVEAVEAMAKYLHTSNCLQRIRWIGELYPKLRHREEVFCSFLPAFQESMSLKELDIEFPLIGGPSNLALENMLTHTQSLQSLSLVCPDGLLKDIAVVAAASGLKKNTSLRELTLECSGYATTLFPILTSLRDHPLLQTLRLRGSVVDLTGLETLLLSENSKITELDICRYYYEGPPMTGLTRVLRALARRAALTKIRLHSYPLSRDGARLLRLALYKMPSLQSLVLTGVTLGSAGLAELAPALYRNTSIKVLNLSDNELGSTESARLLRDVLRHNKTMTALDLSRNAFGQAAGAVECIADGLGSNSTLLKIDLSRCALGDDDISMLAQTLGTTLQKVALSENYIGFTGVGVLLETMEHNSHHITDLELRDNPIGNEGASLLARALGFNALPNLTRLSLHDCDVGNHGFMELVLALEQNTALAQLELRQNYAISEMAFLALAKSLPEIKVLQRFELSWCRGIASAMPSLLVGLRKNESLFRFHVADCAPSSVPPTPEETAKFAGGWMQEMERLGYRNCFLPLIRAPKEMLPPRGVWPRALARVATIPDVIFEVLRSKPSLVSSEDAEGKEAAEETVVPKKRKRGDE